METPPMTLDPLKSINDYTVIALSILDVWMPFLISHPLYGMTIPFTKIENSGKRALTVWHLGDNPL